MIPPQSYAAADILTKPGRAWLPALKDSGEFEESGDFNAPDDLEIRIEVTFDRQ